MTEILDTGSSSPALQEAETAIAWQTQRFPQVAASFANGDIGDFCPAAEMWRRDSDWPVRCLDYQNHFAVGMDERTRGAHLIAFYGHHLSIAAGSVYLKTGGVANLDPERLGIRFESHGPAADAGPRDIRRFHFRFDGFHPGGGATSFHDAFVASLTPVVETLQARTGLSAAAQWRLAADGITGAFLEIGAALGDEERAMAAALAIVKMPGSPLFSSELHYERIEAERGGEIVAQTFRLRSGCCLFYRTQGGDFCDVCVLLDPQIQKKRLRDRLERPSGF